MTHRRALLVALAFAVLFVAGYSILAPQGARGWGSIEIVDISHESDDQGLEIDLTLRFPGARLGVGYRFASRITSAQCGIDLETLSSRRREYGQGDRVERMVLSKVCPADDYEVTVILVGLRNQEIARDTMRFSVPSSP